MAHFFLPVGNLANGPAAASESAISELFVPAGGAGRFGLWGGGFDGKPLTVKVYRAGTVASDGAGHAVHLARAAHDPANHIDVYTAAGLRDGDEVYGMLADGVTRFTGALRIRVHAGKASDVMAEWAQHYRAKQSYARKGICEIAVPYLALDDKRSGAKMEKLADGSVGGPLNSVHGLAIHTTAGIDSRTPFQTARWGCIPTWNGNGASAHFAISGDGTIVQIVPTDFVAFAQHDPGNQQWISAEIDNNGRAPMNLRQLDAAKRLFQWVCANHAVPRRLATGCLFPKAGQFDETTMKVCTAAGADVTHDVFWAAMSRGLSCHWWLDPVKTGRNVHACPGPGILSQLASIVRPGLVC
ncbi:MAG TPA: peptidoglycan recognition family protein [Stellaceae bacterium]|nr:peptidoglycan recognition family protein [Stellaceae bacterium]